MYYLLNMWIFHCHVSLPECNKTPWPNPMQKVYHFTPQRTLRLVFNTQATLASKEDMSLPGQL